MLVTFEVSKLLISSDVSPEHPMNIPYIYVAEDVLKLTKNIYRVDTGDGLGAKVSAIQKKTQELLDVLGVDLLR